MESSMGREVEGMWDVFWGAFYEVTRDNDVTELMVAFAMTTLYGENLPEC